MDLISPCEFECRGGVLPLEIKDPFIVMENP